MGTRAVGECVGVSATKMMHYRKGENVEKELTKADLPFEAVMPPGQETNFLWMQVKGGTKTNNVITYAKNALEKGEYRTVVWTGSGGGVVKTISCAEILKRSFPLYQHTAMCYTSTEEHWKPLMDGLEEIVVARKIPCLHILMSLDVIEAYGVQKPNTTTNFWQEFATSSARRAQQRPQPRLGQGRDKRSRQNQPPKDQPKLQEGSKNQSSKKQTKNQSSKKQTKNQDQAQHQETEKK